MSLTIAIIHLNDSDYLPYTLAQAKISNPQSNIVLIGDDSNKYYHLVEHESIDHHIDEALDFKEIYKHFNTNPYEYELFCFQRWFILKNFMEANNLDKCLYLDSDVMFYANAIKEQSKFADFDFTLSHATSPHCVFINNINTLKSFCEFVIDIYTHSFLTNVMESVFQNQIKNDLPGGACDMTAFKEFMNRRYANICDTTTIIDNSTYDHNINLSEGFAMRDGKKYISFIEEKPFGYHIASEQAIAFNCLHFQGSAKKYVKDYFLRELILTESRRWAIKKAENVLQANSNIGTGSDSNIVEISSLDKTYVILPFKLKIINLLIFPKWSASEESLGSDLERVIRAIATHPNKSQITLLVAQGNMTDEDAALILSSVSMNLLMQEDLDVSEGPEISLVGQLSTLQWEALLSRIQARIVLENENQEAIAAVKAETLPVYNLDSFSGNIGI